MRKKAAIPNMGDYNVVFKILIEDMLNLKLWNMPTTEKTIDLGEKYSPDAICAPFKYHLGHFIEALEDNVEVLVQVNGGCRVGYYGELQEKILKDLGYKFKFYELKVNNKIQKNKIKHYYQNLKEIRKDLNFISFAYHGLRAIITMLFVDYIDKIIRKKSCYEKIPNSFRNTKNNLNKKLSNSHHFITLFYYIIYFFIKIHTIPIKNIKKQNKYKVAIIGELYTLMDKDANNEIELFFNENKIEVIRPLDLSALTIKGSTNPKKLLKKTNPYIKYHLGATATYSVLKTIKYAKKRYDGIIHLKSFGCTPELSALPILQKISDDYDIPILYLSFDLQTSKEGLRTRLEAFIDMLEMRREK